jgi:hypothetical protein
MDIDGFDRTDVARPLTKLPFGVVGLVVQGYSVAEATAMVTNNGGDL